MFRPSVEEGEKTLWDFYKQIAIGISLGNGKWGSFSEIDFLIMRKRGVRRGHRLEVVSPEKHFGYIPKV